MSIKKLDTPATVHTTIAYEYLSEILVIFLGEQLQTAIELDDSFSLLRVHPDCPSANRLSVRHPECVHDLNDKSIKSNFMTKVAHL
jgi:hypothetical protein